ncbi:UDP-N-acetylmuramoyl-L-alanyl-D-glutamate--2,6-diaminopimelate ligase [Pseudooceanicola sp. CBS1P-1]|uniref:UDP-N-acetylmuramoyl-L-alanyl-D-glutamate--2,6-diaminopimelate ligase n=1 Tax=Pseudooceanicola albus TaxID=2692189 RepID=A0A6L7G4G4_9RHOB|nr:MULTISPECIES: UDP-N-acetylmuramoyl-L-alanyl-D-glutamate--2,6-diaminopimelate ligase [Pseudooceanicola]MBT9383066.1 UDP-N-acetylmuramoyl-L-alanyl-D-glutamate--2,6-diaminopimelate ligase [Pseudooceanicola endophyticus]MXN19254.1 UDP-N-acetylmuramoyl-L-alanyl-D-glutamate--2,6-diaminopimelate ligase [Pseudooceanicola albus]
MVSRNGSDGHKGSGRPEFQPVRTLSELGLTARGGREAEITGLAVDSREVRAGYLFAALPGTKVHGADFIQYALQMGAGAILTDPAGARLAAEALKGSDAAVIIAEDPRQVLAATAALWFGGQPRVMCAVTGTNGKTSVATFLRQIWQGLGYRACNLGTTGVEGDYTHPLSHTTPEPITLHRLLAEAASEGVTHCAMEASSHGLAQRRLDGVMLQAAGFTNLTQDHLDYHASFKEYFEAKAGLFTRVLPPEGHAVINIDGARGADMVAEAEARGLDVLTVGMNPDAEMRLVARRFEPEGQVLRIAFADTEHQIRLNLIGGFQAENVLVAAGLAMMCGASPQEVFPVLPRLVGVRGRMQLAATRANGASVFVDYAHTPDAVSTALKALRPHVMGRIVAIIGAGGDRDRTKRPLMGQAAAENADAVFVTDDNPRSEDPGAIRQAVLLGCPEAFEVPDRAEAILRAVDTLGPGDALLIAGKGHETGQIVGDTIYPFDDVEQASVAVAALDGRLA